MHILFPATPNRHRKHSIVLFGSFLLVPPKPASATTTPGTASKPHRTSKDGPKGVEACVNRLLPLLRL